MSNAISLLTCVKPDESNVIEEDSQQEEQFYFYIHALSEKSSKDRDLFYVTERVAFNACKRSMNRLLDVMNRKNVCFCRRSERLKHETDRESYAVDAIWRFDDPTKIVKNFMDTMKHKSSVHIWWNKPYNREFMLKMSQEHALKTPITTNIHMVMSYRKYVLAQILIKVGNDEYTAAQTAELWGSETVLCVPMTIPVAIQVHKLSYDTDIVFLRNDALWGETTPIVGTLENVTQSLDRQRAILKRMYPKKPGQVNHIPCMSIDADPEMLHNVISYISDIM